MNKKSPYFRGVRRGIEEIRIAALTINARPVEGLSFAPSAAANYSLIDLSDEVCFIFNKLPIDPKDRAYRELDLLRIVIGLT